MIISTSEEMNPLHRSTMEDVHVVIPAGTWGTTDPGRNLRIKKSLDSSPLLNDTTYLAVYDGHGGRDTVDFLAQALHTNVTLELLEEDAPIPTRLERALLITDIQLRQYHQSSGGSTVAICLVHRQKHHEGRNICLYTANVGDTRIVLSCNGKALRLSYDHTAVDPLEVKRIIHAGGFCLKGRAMGVLAISRSLGDHGLKQYIIATPYTNTYDLKIETGRDFVIVACDGMWDVFGDQEAVDIVKSWRGAKKDVADELTRLSIQKGTQDNVTVIVCYF